MADGPTYLAGVVVPAHDEERTIGRLLDALTGDHDAPLDIVVAANGCTDATAAVARAHTPEVTVVETPVPGKPAALVLGDAASTVYPRVYVDADVEISARGVAALAKAVAGDGVLAAGPVRRVPREGIATLVRWYYDVWELLPQVRTGLFGRGVIALSEAGHARVRALPTMMSDDLVVSEAFSDRERTIVAEAVVVVHPPRTTRDLVRRRVRVATGNAQADAAGLRAPTATTGVRTLLGIAVEHPRAAPKLLVFVAVTLVARTQARRAVRRGDFNTWLRDESSRSDARG
ncbi:hypothetical protein ASE38_01460 [Cellulomonas sp. Root930]|nr:hypothetical protein ASE38_01460 [Cellulomonas sp. Root930]